MISIMASYVNWFNSYDLFRQVTPEFETLLFNLLILGELTDDCGRVWKRNSYDLYIVEITNSTSMVTFFGIFKLLTQ